MALNFTTLNKKNPVLLKMWKIAIARGKTGNFKKVGGPNSVYCLDIACNTTKMHDI